MALGLYPNSGQAFQAAAECSQSFLILLCWGSSTLTREEMCLSSLCLPLHLQQEEQFPSFWGRGLHEMAVANTSCCWPHTCCSAPAGKMLLFRKGGGGRRTAATAMALSPVKDGKQQVQQRREWEWESPSCVPLLPPLPGIPSQGHVS